MSSSVRQRIRPWFNPLLIVISYSLLWLFLDLATVQFETAPEVVLFYPPAGLDFVLLLVFGLRYLPALLIPTTIDGLFLPTFLPWQAVLFYATAKVVIYGGFAALLLHGLRFDPCLNRLRHVVNFVVFASLLSPVFFALVTVTDLAVSGIVPWSEWQARILHFWAGYSIGIVSFTPVMLIWIVPWLKKLLRFTLPLPAYPEAVLSRGSQRRPNPNSHRLLSAVLEAGAILLGTWIAFGVEIGGYTHFLYVAFLPMIWVAVRYGLEMTTIVILVINLGAAGVKWLDVAPDALGIDLAGFQFCMLAVSQTALLLGSVISRRMQALERIRQQALDAHLLNQIGNALNSTLKPEAILERIVQLVGENFAVDRVVLWKIGSETVQVLHEWRRMAQIPSMLGVSLPCSEWFAQLDADGDRFQQTVFQSQNYQEIRHPPNRDALIQEMRIRSIVRVPIFIRETFFGSLSLHTLEVSRYFTRNEIFLLEQIADQAAIALFNAQSHEQLEQLVRIRTQELEIANRAKSDFLSTMSHELRTPLTSIIGFSSVLKQQVFGHLESRQLQYIELIHRSGEHLLALVNDILDLARIEAQREELEFVEIAVEELCQSCMAIVQYQAETKGLTLNFQIADDVSHCIADLRRLRQILLNLLSNAVKFTETGSVCLHVERSSRVEDTAPGSEWLQFSVIDTGIGIPAADLNRLFQPFEQLESGLDRHHEGTGLGLALSQRLAELMGGKITVGSELGRGSCFTLRLPIAP